MRRRLIILLVWLQAMPTVAYGQAVRVLTLARPGGIASPGEDPGACEVSDSFTAANGAPLSAANWTVQQGGFQHDGNRIESTDEENNQAFYTGCDFTDDQEAEVTIVDSGTGDGLTGGLIVRGASNTGYVLHYTSSNVALYKQTGAASFTQLQSFVGFQASDGSRFRLRIVGTTIRVYLDESQLGTDTTDSDYTSGDPGLHMAFGGEGWADDFVARSLEGGGGGEGPVHTVNNWADIQDVYDDPDTEAGDTIRVTSGSETVTATLNLTNTSKHVNIECETPGGCTITDDVPTDEFTTISEATTGSFVIQGFVFVSLEQKNDTLSIFHVDPTASGDPVIFYNNTFNNVEGSNVFYWKSNKGLITTNTFNGVVRDYVPNNSCYNNSAVVRHKPEGDGASWTTVSNFGDADTSGTGKLYIENNTIFDMLEGIDTDDNGRTVVIKNTITNSGTLTHGEQEDGGRIIEYLFNTVIRDITNRPNCAGGTLWVAWTGVIGYRSGTGRVIGNVIPDIGDGLWGFNKNEVTFELQALRRLHGPWACWDSGYPHPAQPGWGWITGATEYASPADGYFGDLEPIYIAANTGAGDYTAPVGSDYDPNECMSTETIADYIISDRDYYKQTGGIQTSSTSPFNGTTGTGYGTRANRPSTCTTGVVYWATNAGGNWDSTNGTSDDGTLDKCTSTNTWTNGIYTPFTYPHPLTP